MTRQSIAALLIAAVACSDSSAPKVQTTAPASFGIRPALDTVAVGDSLTFVAERADSTVDQWVVSDASLARVHARQKGWARVIALAAGTVTIKATRQADSGQATLVIRASSPPDTTKPPADTTKPPGTPAVWEAIDLGVLDAQSTAASAINDAGTIVGRIYERGDGPHGFVYQNGVMRKLQRLGNSSEAPEAITASGKIAGSADGGHLVVWDTPDAAPRRLGEPSQSRHVRGVNDRGDILVMSEPGPGTVTNGELWRNDVPVNLGSLSDTSVPHPRTVPRALNNRGQVVGTSQVDLVRYADSPPDDLSHPFLWENGVMRDLGVLTPSPCGPFVVSPEDCAFGGATSINSNGVVVGHTSAERVRAFIWEDGEMHGLGVYSGRQTRALAINDRRQVLGIVGPDSTFLWENGQARIVIVDRNTAFNWPLLLGSNGEVVGSMSVGGEQHAFVWQAGHLTDLGPGEAVAINKRGDIVGSRGTRAMLWRKKG